ncbi:regulator of microtubule dynamics protein 1 isoform X1 [Ixodes scapularis]|uniref:regulator of microtubule dynamics protein 1 isoform X1 n=2 Tax=Ixodes scapularis TaxID=6945 RepID=UPI001A9E50E9|nr:regulator of microtubule dynamics protein 1 isoform X1 [Ixodes scapularis]
MISHRFSLSHIRLMFAVISRQQSYNLSLQFKRLLPLIKSRPVAVPTITPPIFLLCGFTLFKMSEVEQLKQEVDSLHTSGGHEKAYQLLLPYRDSTDAELLWRLARATFKRCEFAPKPQKQAGLAEGISYLDRAVEVGGDKLGDVHKWYGILIGSKVDHPSTKDRIKDGFLIKQHVQRAIELMPNDPINFHVLGNWCFEVAATPWYVRKAGQLIFSEIPTATYEEALKHFLKAEEVRPNYYSRNFLMIAKTLIELKRNDDAVSYLHRARDFTPKASPDDEEVSKEAKKLLEKLGAL